MKLLFTLFLIIFTWGCTPSQKESSKSEASANGKTALVQQSWIEERVSAARQRLENSPAGQKIWQAIEAHGGLSRWYGNGRLQFHFNYQPLGGILLLLTYLWLKVKPLK